MNQPSLLIMTSFVEKHFGRSFTLWPYRLLMAKLFTPIVPICSQPRPYICYLGEFTKKKLTDFSAFPRMTYDVIDVIKGAFWGPILE